MSPCVGLLITTFSSRRTYVLNATIYGRNPNTPVRILTCFEWIHTSNFQFVALWKYCEYIASTVIVNTYTDLICYFLYSVSFRGVDEFMSAWLFQIHWNIVSAKQWCVPSCDVKSSITVTSYAGLFNNFLRLTWKTTFKLSITVRKINRRPVAPLTKGNNAEGELMLSIYLSGAICNKHNHNG